MSTIISLTFDLFDLYTHTLTNSCYTFCVAKHGLLGPEKRTQRSVHAIQLLGNFVSQVPTGALTLNPAGGLPSPDPLLRFPMSGINRRH